MLVLCGCRWHSLVPGTGDIHTGLDWKGALDSRQAYHPMNSLGCLHPLSGLLIFFFLSVANTQGDEKWLVGRYSEQSCPSSIDTRCVASLWAPEPVRRVVGAFLFGYHPQRCASQQSGCLLVNLFWSGPRAANNSSPPQGPTCPSKSCPTPLIAHFQAPLLCYSLLYLLCYFLL
jgi:hypothetical protein